MKFKRAWDYKEVPTEWSLAEAIETQIEEDSDSSAGSIEIIEARLKSTSRMVSGLVRVLADKGLLNQEDVLKLLPSFEAIK